VSAEPLLQVDDLRIDLALGDERFAAVQDVSFSIGRSDPDAGERLDGSALGLLPGRALVQDEHLGDLPADRRHRIERGHRLLEDH